MPEFEHVTPKEAAPYKDEILALIKLVQDEVNEYFTLDRRFIGSSVKERNMITHVKVVARDKVIRSCDFAIVCTNIYDNSSISILKG